MKVSLFIVLLLAGGVAQGPTAAVDAGAAATAPEGYPDWIATAGATAKTKCSLSMQGYGDRPGLKAVQLSCTGGTVTARAHKVLKKFWGSNMPKQGVVWTEDEECRPRSTGCLLTICGKSDAVFTNTQIIGVRTAPGTASEQGDTALCISHGSKVTLQDCKFNSSSNSSLVAYDNTTSVLLDRCSVSNNNMTMRSAWAWGILANNASIVVRSSTFTRNRIQKGGTIGAFITSRLAVLNSTLSGNTVDEGGALFVAGTAQVTIQSSRFEANNASTGGALYVQNTAQVTIQGSSFQANNATWGGALHVRDTARVTIQGNNFEANNATYGGALYVRGRATAAIQGSQFESNNASSGGAIYATDQAKVDILSGSPRTAFINNTATSGADISAAATSVVHINGAHLTGGTASNTSGSIALTKSSTMSMVNTLIQGAQSKNFAGCVMLLDNSTLRVSNSTLSGCKTGGDGGGVYVANTARLVLVNSTISDSVAGWSKNGTKPGAGGGICAVRAASVKLQGSTIHSNIASSHAGGLGLYNNASLVLLGPMKTRLVNNTAKVTGGGLRLGSQNYSSAELSDLLLADKNFAPTSPFVSYVATRITVVDDGGADSVIASDSREAMLVLTLNISGPHGQPSQDGIGYFVFKGGVLYRDYVAANTTAAGRLRQLEVLFKDPPGKYRLVIARGLKAKLASVNITIIPCPKGFVTGGRGDTCNPCPEGLYSFDATDTICTLCPANAQCPGRDVVWPMAGFWMSAPQSNQTHRCHNRDACIGAKALNGTTDNQTATRHPLNAKNDAEYKNAQCSEPYQGNLCGQCKQGYGKVRPFHCRKCMAAGAIVVLYLLAAATMIGLVKLLVFFQTAADLSSRTDLQRPIPAEMLRALVIHMQWLYIIGNLDVPLPQSLLYPIQIVGGIWSSTSGSSIGIECILSSASKVPVAIQKVLISLFTPAGILLAVLVIEAILHYLRPRKSQAIGHDFASVVMCIVFMFLPTWVSTALSLFTCIPLDTPAKAPYQAKAVGSWWAEDMSQLCYDPSGYHRGWALGLGIPLTLLFCVALPAGVFLFMWFSRKQGKLQDMQFQKHYGFVYRLWREERCWWESVVLLQTCALVMVSTFGFALGPFYQTMVSAAVLAWIAIALLAVRPFKCPAAGRVAVISVCVLFFTAYACLSFLPYNNAGPGSVYSNIMGAVVLIANVIFLMCAAWLLMQSVNWAAVVAWFSAGCCGSLSNFVAQDGVAGARGSSAGTQSKVRESAGGPAELPK